MTREDAFNEINEIQDYYIDELIKLINNPEYENMKTISFTSPTGTGKTKMMSKLINKYPQFYFIVTTLSKSQLYIQISNSLSADCNHDNYRVYGSADYKINSVLEAKDIINEIPDNTKCIWIRDEGHIRTNRFEELLVNVCYKIINFSATNIHSDIVCNFTQTMMLRTVNQVNGSPYYAINRLLEIKKTHKEVSNYNPCAIFRCTSGDESLYEEIIKLCNNYKLKYINITDDKYDMADLCRDDNQYDVIINKYKLVEGIDIRRAHVLFMDNQPGNVATTIQAIGRCRRNALLYRNDIDIMSPKNKKLLEETRKCYVYYDVEKMKVDTDEYGELQYAFCDHISCEALKAGMSIYVSNGQLSNGLYVIELEGETGKFNIIKDEVTGCNVVEPLSKFYGTEIVKHDANYVYLPNEKIHFDNVRKLISYSNGYGYAYFPLDKNKNKKNVEFEIPQKLLEYYQQKKKEYYNANIFSKMRTSSLEYLIEQKMDIDIPHMRKVVENYLLENSKKRNYIEFCKIISNIDEFEVKIGGFYYHLKDVCSDNEIVIIAYFCIRKKEKYMANDDIKQYISMALEQRSELYARIYYPSEIAKSLFFDTSRLSNYEEHDKLINFINKFIEEYKLKEEYIDFCKFISGIQDGSLESDSFGDSRKIFSSGEIEYIQFLCISEKQNGLSDKEILKKVMDYMSAKYKLNLKRADDKSEKLIYILFEQENMFYYNLELEPFSVEVDYPCELSVSESDIENYFRSIRKEIDNILNGIDNRPCYGIYKQRRTVFAKLSLAIDCITDCLEQNEEKLKDNIIPNVVYDFSGLFEKLTPIEDYLVRNEYIETHTYISKANLLGKQVQIPYKKINNDRESAIIGVDLMKQESNDWDNVVWSESTSVTSKIGSFNKLNTYITNHYANELEQAKTQYITGHNEFKLNKKCNSMIGYCVEYYSKYLVYGRAYLYDYIERALKEMNVNKVTNAVIVRACILKYRRNMIMCYGMGVTRVIKSIGAESLLKNEYQYFVDLIVELGEKTAKYVKKTLYPDIQPKDNIDLNLSIKHIAGLADYITEDTILDVKVKNHIDERSIRQVLAYHYLSTKRSDLHVKRVIVYDATSDSSVVVNISTDKIV